MGFEPEAAEGVLRHVANDPLGREDLRGGGDVFLLDNAADHFILSFADIELVEPADDFDLLPVGLLDALDHVPDNGIGMQ